MTKIIDPIYYWPFTIYYYNSLRNNLFKSREELDKIQNKKIRHIIKHSYENVSFYRELFKGNNITHDDIKTVDDLNKIPIIRKKDLMEKNPDYFISKKYAVNKLNKMTTGGSTGEPLLMYISEKEKCWRTAIHLRGNLQADQKIYHKWAVLDTVEEYIKDRNNTPILPHFSIPVLWSLDRQISLLESIKPDVLDGLSSTLYPLSQEAFDKHSISPKLVFGTGELISQSQREIMEEAFDSIYMDQISATEVGRVAWECEQQDGYHMNVDSTVIQFLDEEGCEVSSGERGEMTYTSLHNFAFPILRYAIGDIGVPIDGECYCGVSLPLMKLIEGRQSSFLVFPDGEVVAPMRIIETLGLFKLSEDVKQYKIIQHRADKIEILIVINESANEEIIRELALSNLQREFGASPSFPEVKISVNFVDKIPKTYRGKINVVSSKINPPRLR